MIVQIISRTAAVAALALCVFTAGHAAAQPVFSDAVSVHVDLSDLDLRNASGLKMAMRRIETAAVNVCGGRPDIRRLQDVQAYNDCHRQSIAGAAERLSAIAASGRKNATYAIAVR